MNASGQPRGSLLWIKRALKLGSTFCSKSNYTAMYICIFRAVGNIRCIVVATVEKQTSAKSRADEQSARQQHGWQAFSLSVADSEAHPSTVSFDSGIED